MRYIAIIFFLFTIVSCIKRDTDVASPLLGYYQKTRLWPGATVKICYDSMKPKHKYIRDMIEKIAITEITRATGFTFTGFLSCKEITGQYVIKIGKKGTANAALGYQKNRRKLPYMSLYEKYLDGNTITRQSLHNIILHELGHLMSLRHEQARPDNKNSTYCHTKRAYDIPHSGSVSVGSYDRMSIMNYCNSHSFQKRLTLSLGDVKTIKQAYGILTPAEETYLLRCQEHSLRKCLKERRGRERCLQQECNGGDLLCFQPEKLKKCAKGQGGEACMSEAIGNCKTFIP